MSKKSRKPTRSRPPRQAPEPVKNQRAAEPSGYVSQLREKPVWLAVMAAAVVLSVAVVVLASCQQGTPPAAPPAAARPTAASSEKSPPPASPPAARPTEASIPAGEKSPPAMAINPAKSYVATIETDKGKIVAELYAQDAPATVNNFVALARSGFYNNLTFHRVEPDFVIQGGDPKGDGTGGPGYTLPAEIKRQHTEGALAMARLGDQVNPQRRSSGSQFYITLKATPFLDGQYTVFGQVKEGMNVVKSIARGDKIKQVTIEEK